MSDHAIVIGGSNTIPEFPLVPAAVSMLLVLTATTVLRGKRFR